MATITKSHQPNGFSLFHHKSFSCYFLDISNRRLFSLFLATRKTKKTTDTNTAMERKIFVFISFSKMCTISYKTRNENVSRLDCAGVIGKRVKGLPSWKRSFSKRLIEPEEFENTALRFRVDRKHFENGGCQNVTSTSREWCYFPAWDFFKRKSKRLHGIAMFLTSPGVVRTKLNFDASSEWKHRFQILPA